MISLDFWFHQRAPRHQVKPRARPFAKPTVQLAERCSKMNVMLNTAGRRWGEAEISLSRSLKGLVLAITGA